MSRQAGIGIVIADDHRLFREGLQILLGNQRGMRILGMAANGEEAVQLVTRHHPEILLLDIDMTTAVHMMDRLINSFAAC